MVSKPNIPYCLVSELLLTLAFWSCTGNMVALPISVRTWLLQLDTDRQVNKLLMPGWMKNQIMILLTLLTRISLVSNNPDSFLLLYLF